MKNSKGKLDFLFVAFPASSPVSQGGGGGGCLIFIVVGILAFTLVSKIVFLS